MAILPIPVPWHGAAHYNQKGNKASYITSPAPLLCHGPLTAVQAPILCQFAFATFVPVWLPVLYQTPLCSEVLFD